MHIAREILNQLGGNKFCAMVGVKDLVFGEKHLQFRIGRGAMNGANLVRVTLDPTDTYTLQFFKVRGINCAPCGDAFSLVHAGQLQDTFTYATGMYTRL